MLSFRDFTDEIRNRIPDYLLQFDIEDIHVNKVIKNNGLTLTGMSIVLSGENISPNIYLDEYYNEYLQNDNIDDIIFEIAAVYTNIRETKDISNLWTGNENIQDKVYMKLVNYDKNKELLSRCPYIPYMDMAITFRILVKEDAGGIASSLIEYGHLETFDLNKAELYELAKENTPRLFLPQVTPLNEVLAMEMPGFEVSAEEVSLIVVTNDRGVNGATAMLYDGVLDSFDKDMYILPSSIHEVLLLPADMGEPKELQEMVMEINSTIVKKDEILSDNVYKYDAKEKKVEQVTNIERDQAKDDIDMER